MTTWSQQDIHKHMHVYSSDNEYSGNVIEKYEDSFKMHKGLLFTKNRYYPYGAISRVEGDQVYLRMNAEEAKEMQWKKRPDYQAHRSDPLQLFYDRGHGLPDPYDETNPNR